MNSSARKTAERSSDFFKYHTLEDVAGMAYDKIISFGEAAEVIEDMLERRYPGVINLNDVIEYFHDESLGPKDYFYRVFGFGKALGRLR